MKKFDFVKAIALAALLLSLFASCKKTKSDPQTSNTDTTSTSDSIVTNLPVMNITTAGGAPIVSEDDYIGGSVTINGAGIYPDFTGAMTIKGHGNSTWGLPKKPYHLKFSSKTAIYNMASNKDFILLANDFDNTLMRNEVALYLGQLSDLDWTPHSVFTEVYLNGVFVGNYQVTESVDQSSTKVNITNSGFLLCIDPLNDIDSGDVYFQAAQSQLLFDIKNPSGVVANDANYTYIQNYINETESALFGDNFTDTALGYRHYVDVPSFVDWYLINEIFKNQDAQFYASCYLNLIPGGLLKMGPIWDFDLSSGNPVGAFPTANGLWVATGSWIARMLQDSYFVQQVQTRFNYYYAQMNNINSNIDSCESLLHLSVLANNSVWSIFGSGTDATIWGDYTGSVTTLKAWLELRMGYLKTAYAAMD